MKDVPTCEEKARLLRAYTVAIGDYHRAYESLNARLGVMSRREYDKLRALAEQSRENAELARAALGRHTAAHGC
jgi:hypothetical protein